METKKGCIYIEREQQEHFREAYKDVDEVIKVLKVLVFQKSCKNDTNCCYKRVKCYYF